MKKKRCGTGQKKFVLVALERQQMISLDFVGQLAQALKHLAIAVEKGGLGELDVMMAANFARAPGNFVQVVARHVREHVVLHLEVQAAHEPIHQKLRNDIAADGVAGTFHLQTDVRYIVASRACGHAGVSENKGAALPHPPNTSMDANRTRGWYQLTVTVYSSQPYTR